MRKNCFLRKRIRSDSSLTVVFFAATFLSFFASQPIGIIGLFAREKKCHMHGEDGFPVLETREYFISPPGEPFAPGDPAIESSVSLCTPRDITVEFPTLQSFIHAIARLPRKAHHFVIDFLTEEFFKFCLSDNCPFEDIICYEYLENNDKLTHVTTLYIHRGPNPTTHLSVYFFLDVIKFDFTNFENLPIRFVVPAPYLFQEKKDGGSRCCFSQWDYHSCSFIAYKLGKKLDKMLLLHPTLISYLNNFTFPVGGFVESWLNSHPSEQISLSNNQNQTIQYHFRFQPQRFLEEAERISFHEGHMNSLCVHAIPNNFFSVIQKPSTLLLLSFIIDTLQLNHALTFVQRFELNSSSRIRFNNYFTHPDDILRKSASQRDSSLGYAKYGNIKSIQARIKILENDRKQKRTLFANSLMEFRQGVLFILNHPDSTEADFQHVLQTTSQRGFKPTDEFYALMAKNRRR